MVPLGAGIDPVGVRTAFATGDGGSGLALMVSCCAQLLVRRLVGVRGRM